MDILLKHGIHIDNFKIEKQENVKVFLLTHGHKDHAKNDLKRFTPMVHCSYLTSLLIKHKNTIFLVPNQSYIIHGIKIYVFDTIHCPGSLGFFFPDLRILHFGDSRVTSDLLQLFKKLNPQIILYDNTHQHFDGMFPSIETSALMLGQVVKQLSTKFKKTIYVCLPHIGPILLLKSLNLKVKPDTNSLKPQVLILLDALKLVDNKSSIIAVGMKSSEIDIMPSSQYFVVNGFDPHKVVHDKEKERDMIRIFASFHAGHTEISLMSDYKLVSLNYNEE